MLVVTEVSTALHLALQVMVYKVGFIVTLMVLVACFTCVVFYRLAIICVKKFDIVKSFKSIVHEPCLDISAAGSFVVHIGRSTFYCVCILRVPNWIGCSSVNFLASYADSFSIHMVEPMPNITFRSIQNLIVFKTCLK